MEEYPEPIHLENHSLDEIIQLLAAGTPIHREKETPFCLDTADKRKAFAFYSRNREYWRSSRTVQAKEVNRLLAALGGELPVVRGKPPRSAAEKPVWHLERVEIHRFGGLHQHLGPNSTATIKMTSAELTGAGESVKVRQEGKANHYFHREPCGRTREGAFEASAAARVAGMIEQRKRYGPECRGFLIGRRQYLQNRHGEGLPGSALSEESRDARTPLAGTREGFDSPWQSCRGRGRRR